MLCTAALCSGVPSSLNIPCLVWFHPPNTHSMLLFLWLPHFILTPSIFCCRREADRSVLLLLCVCVCVIVGNWQQFHFLHFFCHSGEQANGATNDFGACHWLLISFLNNTPAAISQTAARWSQQNVNSRLFGELMNH